jgi:signal transduction histidine kinase
MEKLAERERQDAETEVARLGCELLADMSHELRAPLGSIIGVTEQVCRGKAGVVSAAQQELLGQVISSARQLLQVISDAVDLAGIGSGQLVFRMQRVDLAGLVAEVQEVIGALARRRQIRLEVAVAAGIDEVIADPCRLKQVLYCLLSNAIAATVGAGVVTVRVGPWGEGKYLVEVEDRGLGIERAALERVFLEFQAGRAGSGHRGVGAGLGLALSKQIVEAHGGHIGVESTPGAGSRFYALLPRAGR